VTTEKRNGRPDRAGWLAAGIALVLAILQAVFSWGSLTADVRDVAAGVQTLAIKQEAQAQAQDARLDELSERTARLETSIDVLLDLSP